MNIEIKQTVSREVLEDIFVTALEGGSNYWYFLSEKAVKKIRKAVPKSEDPYLSTAILKAIEKGVEIPINDAEDEEWEIGTLSIKSIQDGLQKLSESSQRWALERHMNEDRMDADSADVVLQYMIFGEVIYG